MLYQGPRVWAHLVAAGCVALCTCCTLLHNRQCVHGREASTACAWCSCGLTAALSALPAAMVILHAAPAESDHVHRGRLLMALAVIVASECAQQHPIALPSNAPARAAESWPIMSTRAAAGCGWLFPAWPCSQPTAQCTSMHCQTGSGCCAALSARCQQQCHMGRRQCLHFDLPFAAHPRPAQQTRSQRKHVT